MKPPEIDHATEERVLHSSIHDVAALAGVSTGTVSNFLNHPERVGSLSREKVQGAITKLNFIRNDAASQLRRGSSNTIALLVPDISDPLYIETARGAASRAEQARLSLVIANSEGDQGRESRYLSAFAQQRIRGVLFAPTAEHDSSHELQPMHPVPVVLIGGRSVYPTSRSVLVDDFEGGRLASAHLSGNGARRIMLVSGPVGDPRLEDRLAGARSQTSLCTTAFHLSLQTAAATITHGQEAGHLIRNMSTDTRPDAIFTTNGLLAIGLIQALNSGTIPLVPRRIMVVGCDDTPTEGYDVVGISTIRLPAAEMGKQAVDTLLGVPQSATAHVLLSPELIIRESSTGPITDGPLLAVE